MKRKKIIVVVLCFILFVISIFLYLNWGNFVYTGRINKVEIDCSLKGEILDEVYKNDKMIRKPNFPFEQFAKIDHNNQELVISLLEECGMPTLSDISQNQMNAIWLTLQHTNKKQRKKHFVHIKEAVRRGDLSLRQLGLMQDRMLVDEGKPQMYGTQIVNGKLYKLASPEKVNELRKEMGMRPIEDYLKDYNIEFE